MGNQYIKDNQANMVDAGPRLTTCDGTCPAPTVSAWSQLTSLVGEDRLQGGGDALVGGLAREDLRVGGGGHKRSPER